MTEQRWIVPLSDVEADDGLAGAGAEAVRSGWWSAGPRVAELERQFAQRTGARHAVAVANGTAALHLSLLAVGVGPGDEVVVPSLTFVAVANAVRLTGASPVFCDVLGSRDLNLDVADLEAAITPRTKAIVPLHYGGFPCDVEALLRVATGRDVAMIEDAAHAVGATVGGRACGTFGATGCFSFFSNKNLPIAEGGMVITDDPELDERIRLLRSHGMTTLTWDRHRGHASSYDVLVPGFNYRMDDIRAALALHQLERLTARNDRRRQAADVYRSALDGVADVELVFAGRDDLGTAAHHLAVVVLPATARREDVRRALAADGVQTSVHYPPIHRFTAYRDRASRPLPVTDDVAPRLLSLPLFPQLTDELVRFVADRLLAALERSSVAA